MDLRNSVLAGRPSDFDYNLVPTIQVLTLNELILIVGRLILTDRSPDSDSRLIPTIVILYMKLFSFARAKRNTIPNRAKKHYAPDRPGAVLRSSELINY